MKITSKVIEIIRPEIASAGATISLSSIDQIVPRLYTRFLLFFPTALPVQSLKESLSTALTTFSPLAGRYRLLPNKGLQIQCTDDGAEFHEASVDAELKVFNGFQQHDPRFQILSPCGHSADGDITQAPLLVVQVNHFTCGGSSLVVAIHHNVADGFAMSSFIKAWSQICCKSNDLVVQPCFDHSLLCGRRNPSPSLNSKRDEYQTEFPSVPAAFPELKAWMFRFTDEQIQALRIRTTCHPGATRFEVLAGHIWKFVTKARKLASDEETKLGFSVDGRTRLINPPLPEGYFGNAIFYACAASRVDDLVKNPTSHAVDLVHQAIQRMTDEYLRSAIDWLEEQESPLNVFPTFCNAATDLAMTSWSKFPLYEADFGCGRPAFVGLPVASFTGLIIFMPSSVKDTMTVLVGLYAEHMENLLADPEFVST